MKALRPLTASLMLLTSCFFSFQYHTGKNNIKTQS